MRGIFIAKFTSSVDALYLLVRSAGRPRGGRKVFVVRRIVRDYIAAAIDRQRPDLERYIAEHLECPAAVPLTFTEPVASVQEVRRVKIVPRFPGDFPEVDAIVAMSITITASTRQRGVDLGMRTFLIDVEVNAIGTVAGHGYDLVPQRAWLAAWYGRGGNRAATPRYNPQSARAYDGQATTTAETKCPSGADSFFTRGVSPPCR